MVVSPQSTGAPQPSQATGLGPEGKAVTDERLKQELLQAIMNPAQQQPAALPAPEDPAASNPAPAKKARKAKQKLR